MKRLVLALAGIFMIPLIIAPPARAVNDGLLFGQKHAYSVTFRKNGEAIVYARVTVSNAASDPLSELSFSTGSDSITELTALQMVLPPACEKYNYSSGTTLCEKYGDPDYSTTYSYNPDGEQTKYYRLDPKQENGTIKLTLHDAIVPDKSGAVILAYVSKSYVTGGLFGTQRYAFRTLGAATRQSDTTIGISLDSGLTFKEKQPQYGGVIPMMGVAELSARDTNAGTVSAIENKTLDNTVAMIGSGQKTETASGVAPNEQFSVTGEFATSRTKLYWREIVWSILTLLVSVAVMVVIIVVLIRQARKSRKK